MDYFLYLQTRLNHAKQNLANLDEDEKQEAVLLANINNVRNILFEVLDYTVNHFPRCFEKSNNLYFPLLKPNELIGDLQNNKKFKDSVSLIGENVSDYLIKSYSVIFDAKYDKCLLLLTGLTKHRNQDFIIDKKVELREMDVVGNGCDIKQDIYGGIDIPGVLKLENSSNVVFKNCFFSGPNGDYEIRSLEMAEVEGNSLIINKNDLEFRVLIKPFLEKSVQCCEEIINLWKQYFDNT